MQVAFVYKWTHIPSLKWYVGSRTAKGCHPDDGYICSSKIIERQIKENPSEWKRDVVQTGPVEDMLLLETEILQLTDAKNDPRSFNKHNNDGIFVQTGDKNPMKDPVIAEKVCAQIRGDKHWTRNLNGRTHPQIGQKRPSITGDKHPNKNPVVAARISRSHKGKKHPYQIGDKNPMRDPTIAAKISGDEHWVNKIENKRTCEYCGIENISKSNYTRWHGNKCKQFKE